MNKNTKPKRNTRWITIDPAGNTEEYEVIKDKQGRMSKGKRLENEYEKKVRKQQKNTIAFKKKYKVSPNFVEIIGIILLIPYFYFIMIWAGEIIQTNDVWPFSLWIMAFAYPLFLGYMRKFRVDKYGTNSINEPKKKIVNVEVHFRRFYSSIKNKENVTASLNKIIFKLINEKKIDRLVLMYKKKSNRGVIIFTDNVKNINSIKNAFSKIEFKHYLPANKDKVNK